MSENEKTQTKNLLQGFQILNWRFNDKLNKFELMIEKDDKQETVVLNVEFIEQMHELIPSSKEEELIKDVLKAIYHIRKKRVLNVDDHCEEVDKLRKLHDEARTALKGISAAKKGGKNEILKWSSIVKSLAAEKVLLAEKRYLTKLLAIEEADLRGRLAKIIAGR